jgi:hypothetical protein
MTPQEKKRRSLENDCRNTYGENDKSSRKSIRLRKRWVNRAYRRSTNQALIGDSPEQIADGVASVVRKDWRKSPDTPLGDMLIQNRNWSVARELRKTSSLGADFLDALSVFLTAQDLHEGRSRVLMRRLRAVVMDPNSSLLKFDPDDLVLIERFIKEYQRERFGLES